MAFYDADGVLQQGSIDPYLAARRQQWMTATRQKQAAAHRGKVFKTALGGAALFGGAIAAPALFGAGGAAGAGAASLPGAATAGMIPASTAGAAGGAGLSLAGVMRHPLTKLAVPGVFGLLQQRSQNKANDRATRDQMAFADKQLMLEQERLANERADVLAARDEDRRRWEAEDVYRRSQLERDNQIVDERQNRLRAFDPYRQMALARLGRFLR